jgi:streptomycin 6-kinase
VEATYELSNLKPVEALSYNYVLSGFQGSQPIILKLGLDIDGFKLLRFIRHQPMWMSVLLG